MGCRGSDGPRGTPRGRQRGGVMAYADVSIIVEGALEEEQRLHTDAEVDELVTRVEREAKADGLETEVYVLWHDHDEADEECACIQYAQDHHPYASFN